MHWQSPTFNVQFSRTIAFACMFNKTTKIEKKHQHLMPKKTKQTRALQACFSKSELEKEHLLWCVLRYYAFHVLWCRERNTRVHGPCMKYFECKVNKTTINIITTFGHFIFCLIFSRFAHNYVCETGICIIVNS